jgi:MSHA biogenesis protein MshP
MAGVFLVVVVGAYIAYLATQSNLQQVSSIDDLQSARAYQAARAGIEWGAYQVIQNGGSCVASSNLPALPGTLASFTVTVTCAASGALTEGGATLVVYRLTSNACNSPPCPNAGTTSSTYVEREVSVSIAR